MHWYRMCENALNSELRIGPGERTRQLYDLVASDAERLPSISWLLGDRRRLPVTRLS
jgi:hypothetical protein